MCDIPDVREINNHANAIHLTNELATKRTNPSPQRFGLASWVFQYSSIGELVMAVVSQGSIANAELMEFAKVGYLVANLVQSLNTEGRYQFALLEDLKCIRAVNLFGKMTGIGRLQPSHDIDLIQCKLNACGWFG